MYFKYYIISLAGIFFWGVVLKLKDEIRANIVMVTTSLVIGLYLAEAVIGFALHSKVVAAKAGIEFDTRTKREVIRDLKSEGLDTVPAVNPATLMKWLHKESAETLFPLGGVSDKTTVYCNESGKYAVFTSDRYGFNNPDAEWDSLPIKWLLTGDSFTQGACVNPGEDVAGQIRSITGESAINLGNNGNGPLIELAALREYAESTRPKKVLWLYFEGNDLSGNLSRERAIPLLLRYLQPGFAQHLIQRQREIDSRLDRHITQARTTSVIHKTGLLRLQQIRRLIGLDNVSIDISPLFTEILATARERTAAWGGQLYFVYLPEFSRYINAVGDHELYRKRREIIDEVKRLDIPVIDIHRDVFENHPDPLSFFPFRIHAHYNAQGYNEVARAIVASVGYNRTPPRTTGNFKARSKGQSEPVRVFYDR
ncbi:MAG: hypothetical protein KJO08_00210 [Gammaproteobacteria bacterium]|nr:hypothetical protein [Gammaproteobacteria bacterium]